jgi:hypothetical protein
MKEKDTSLLDSHLASLKNMQETDPGEFFYTRLRARMERNRMQQNPGRFYSFRPAWTVAVLALLLVVNGFLLSQQHRNRVEPNNNPLRSFAASYDQTIETTY